jgi:alcohol dehydrogenase
MKAAVVPAVSSSWQVRDVPQPQPGPNQVLVKMHASGISYTNTSDARTLSRTISPNLRPRASGRDRCRGSRRHDAEGG